MADKPLSQSNCPFWSRYSQGACSVSSNGLYVPLPGHVLDFCQALHWKQCSRYLRCRKTGHDHALPPAPVRQNRRRHQRLSRSHHLTLYSNVSPDGPTDVYQDYDARSVDLSIGGMCIETAAPLYLEEKIHFAFKKNSPLPDFSGQAEVRWLQKAKTGGTFYSGLRFSDSKPARAIVKFLGSC